MTDKAKSTSSAFDVARQENFTLAEFAMWSRLSRTTVYRLIKDGKLQATKVGRKTIIRREAAEALMARK